MNNAKSKSSTHYDPHHNLLCIVAGCKQGKVSLNVLVSWCSSCTPTPSLSVNGLLTNLFYLLLYLILVKSCLVCLFTGPPPSSLSLLVGFANSCNLLESDNAVSY